MSDWIEFVSDQPLKTELLFWKREIKYWGEESFPQTEFGYFLDTPLCKVFEEEQDVVPYLIRKIPFKNSWGITIDRPNSSSSTLAVYYLLASLTSKSCNWILAADSASRHGFYIERKDNVRVDEILKEYLF